MMTSMMTSDLLWKSGCVSQAIRKLKGLWEHRNLEMLSERLSERVGAKEMECCVESIQGWSQDT